MESDIEVPEYARTYTYMCVHVLTHTCLHQFIIRIDCRSLYWSFQYQNECFAWGM